MKAILFPLLVCILVLVGCGSNPTPPPPTAIPYKVSHVGELKFQAYNNERAVTQIKRELEDTETSVHELSQVIEEQDALIGELEVSNDTSKQKLTESISKLKQAYEAVVQRLNTALTTANMAEKRAKMLSERTARKDEENERLRERGEAMEQRIQADGEIKNQLLGELRIVREERDKLKPYRNVVWWVAGLASLFIFLRYILPHILRALGVSFNPLSILRR